MTALNDLASLDSQPAWITGCNEPLLKSTKDAVNFALDLAEHNVVERTGGPFGAVIYSLDTFQPISAGVNVVVSSGLSIMHAEIAAICAAQSNLHSHEALKQGFGLAISCAPCIMCLGAIHWAGLRRVAFAATSRDAELIGFDEGPGIKAVRDGLKRNGVQFEQCTELRERGVSILKRYTAAGGRIY